VLRLSLDESRLCEKKIADEPSLHDNLPQPITFGPIRKLFGDGPVRDEKKN
jgi:hypothetical protein